VLENKDKILMTMTCRMARNIQLEENEPDDIEEAEEIRRISGITKFFDVNTLATGHTLTEMLTLQSNGSVTRTEDSAALGQMTDNV